VYEGVASGKKENHLFLYEAALGNWRRLVTKEGAEGYGVLSPDSAHVVFDFTPSAPEGAKRQRGRLWVVDLPSGDAKSLTVNDEDEPGIRFQVGDPIARRFLLYGVV